MHNILFSLQKIIEMITDEQFIKDIRSKIKDDRSFPESYYGSSSGQDDHGTTHISVFSNGDAVALTSSINV